MAFSGFDNDTPYNSFFKRRFARTRGFFARWFPELLATVQVGRDYDDQNRPHYMASGEILTIAQGDNGNFVMFNDVDVEVQAITWRFELQTPATFDFGTIRTPVLALGLLTTAFDPFDVSSSPVFEPQFRPVLEQQRFLPGNVRFALGVSSTELPGSLVGWRMNGPVLVYEELLFTPGLPTQSFRHGAYWSCRERFDPPIVLPRGAGFIMAETKVTGAPIVHHNCEFGVEYRELRQGN